MVLLQFLTHMTLKQQLYKLCSEYVAKRLRTVEHIMASNKKSLEDETKSSAGDKHETGRAMLQLEMEKASQQLQEIQVLYDILDKIHTTTNTSKTIHLGSVIYTNYMNYYVSISAGALVVNRITFYAISVASPIGRALLGKHEGDRISFNNQTIEVLNVI